MKKIPSARPSFRPEDIDGILAGIREALETGAMTLGPRTRELENAFAAYVGTEHAVAVSSGTSALEIAMRHFGVEGREVIVPTNSFVASANAVIRAGGRPVLADIREDTLCLDPDDALERVTDRTRGIMVVHIAGLVDPRIDALRDECRRRGLFLLEDAAHAHGAALGSRKAGALGDAGCFSFFPTKPMTAGEGGMVTTDDADLAELARSLRHHGRDPSGDYPHVGYNWRMSELSAIVGIHQLRRLDEFIDRRNAIARLYEEGLAGTPGVTLLETPEDVRHSYYKFALLLDEPPGDLVERLRERGVATGTVYHPPIHLYSYYRDHFGYGEGSLPVAERVLSRQLCLPMYVDLTDEEVRYVLDAWRECTGGADERVAG